MKKMTSWLSFFLTVTAIASTVACSSTSSPKGQPQPASNIETKVVPAFNADSAYAYIEQQLQFGPRVPGTPAQEQTAQWLANELRRHKAEVVVQQATVTAYDGRQLPMYNIIGSFNPKAAYRVLLMSHWDSRHVCDHDPDPTKRHLPVQAANDGASGVGVLLEVARQLGQQNPQIGIDIFLTDVEDYGAPDDWKGQHAETQWCLGTQYWCKHPHVANYRANYGILLDMVGAKNATFYKEYVSSYFAPQVVDKVWNEAQKLGLGSYFISEDGGAITDDHLFVNRWAQIPTVDIIDTRKDEGGTFFPYWHTSGDTMDKLSKSTLQAVGTLLLHLVY